MRIGKPLRRPSMSDRLGVTLSEEIAANRIMLLGTRRHAVHIIARHPYRPRHSRGARTSSSSSRYERMDDGAVLVARARTIGGSVRPGWAFCGKVYERLAEGEFSRRSALQCTHPRSREEFNENPCLPCARAFAGAEPL